MNNVIELDQIKLAKEIVMRYPDLMYQLDIAYLNLYTGVDFIAINHVLTAMVDAKKLMQLQLDKSNEILEKK